MGRKKDLSEIERLYFRAIKLGLKSDLGEDAYDFASWITVKYLEGKSQHQTLDQSLIDYKRETFGNLGSQKGRARAGAKYINWEDSGL